MKTARKGNLASCLSYGCADLIPGFRQVSVVFGQCKRIERYGLGDRSGTNESHRYAAGYNGPVLDDLNFFEIPTVGAFGDPGRLSSVTAQILCLAAFHLLIAATRLQVSVQLESSRTLNPLIFLESTHGTKMFLIKRLGRRIHRHRTERATAGRRCLRPERAKDNPIAPEIQLSFARGNSLNAGFGNKKTRFPKGTSP